MSRPVDDLPPDVRKTHDLLQTNLAFFASVALKIKTKAGTLEPLVFNDAQQYLHDRLEDQIRRMGMVRVLILKGRQQGCSTYVGGRFYHKATRNPGTSVFILSHEAETTKKLFRIVERYHSNCPEPLRPAARVATKHEYVFDGIQSDYAIGTAGNANVGRGGTVQLFHGSEVAFWENTDGIKTGVMQSVPTMPGTEVILESTANGMGNMFYDMCMDAMEGKGDYELIFIPWYWQKEYSRAIPAGVPVNLTPEEEEYRAAYKLTLEQMYWKRLKEQELGSQWKFKQEYPANPNEAFQTSSDAFLDAEYIIKARKTKLVEDKLAPLIIGVDPGRTRDRTVITWRRGRKVLKYASRVFDTEDLVEMQIVGWLVSIIESDKPDKVFIDVGLGYGIIDRLKELGYGRVVTGVNFGSGAIEESLYTNKRAEMAATFRRWLHGEDGTVDIPDDDMLHRDLLMIPREKQTSSNKMQLVSKELIRTKNNGRSPDIFDAIILTFAFPVKKEHTMRQDSDRPQKVKMSSALNTLNRVRAGRHHGRGGGSTRGIH